MHLRCSAVTCRHEEVLKLDGCVSLSVSDCFSGVEGLHLDECDCILCLEVDRVDIVSGTRGSRSQASASQICYPCMACLV